MKSERVCNWEEFVVVDLSDKQQSLTQETGFRVSEKVILTSFILFQKFFLVVFIPKHNQTATVGLKW